MKLTKEEDQVVCKFLKNIIDESGEQLFKLTQFMLLQWSEEAIRMNAAEIALKQTIDYEGDRYNTRMSIQLKIFINMFYDNLLKQANYEPLYDEDISQFESLEQAQEYLEYVQSIL